jgi:hypothetical protein
MNMKKWRLYKGMVLGAGAFSVLVAVLGAGVKWF